MKKYAAFFFLGLLLLNPIGLNAAEDKYGTGKTATADPDVFIKPGHTVLKFPDTGPTNSEKSDKEEEKRKAMLDKKVDDAINKAWEKD